jgi:hypothetical protein
MNSAVGNRLFTATKVFPSTAKAAAGSISYREEPIMLESHRLFFSRMAFSYVLLAKRSGEPLLFSNLVLTKESYLVDSPGFYRLETFINIQHISKIVSLSKHRAYTDEYAL